MAQVHPVDDEEGEGSVVTKQSSWKPDSPWMRPLTPGMRRKASHALKSKRALWLTDPHVFWRHPSARLCVPLLVLGQDFFIYAEDPVNDSHVEANFPGMGHILGMITLHTAESVELAFAKLFLVVLAILIGTVVGRLVLVRLIRGRLKLAAFNGCEGALFTVVLVVCGMLLIASLAYNLLAIEPISGASLEIMVTLGARTLQYRHINQWFQTLSGIVDILTIVMVADALLQDQKHYPHWAPRAKQIWISKNGRFRVVAFWAIFIGGSVLTGVMVFSTGKGSHNIRWSDTTLGGTSEVFRSVLAASIVFTDLLVVGQDWDFPAFEETGDLEVSVKVAGTFWSRLSCNCLGELLRKMPRCQLHPRLSAMLPPLDFFELSISGQWLTYGPLLGVMLIDLFYARTQIMYEPSKFGQYVDPHDQRIWVIVDEAYLALAYKQGKLVEPSMITYSARRNQTTGMPISASARQDVKLNSKFIESTAVKFIAMLVALLFIAAFLCFYVSADWQFRYFKRKLKGASPCQDGGEDLVLRSHATASVVSAPTPSEGHQDLSQKNQVAVNSRDTPCTKGEQDEDDGSKGHTKPDVSPMQSPARHASIDEHATREEVASVDVSSRSDTAAPAASRLPCSSASDLAPRFVGRAPDAVLESPSAPTAAAAAAAVGAAAATDVSTAGRDASISDKHQEQEPDAKGCWAAFPETAFAHGAGYPVETDLALHSLGSERDAGDSAL